MSDVIQQDPGILLDQESAMDNNPSSPEVLDVVSTMTEDAQNSTVVLHVISNHSQGAEDETAHFQETGNEVHTESNAVILSESVVLTTNSDLVHPTVYEHPTVILSSAGPLSSVGMLPSPAALTSSVLSSPLCSVLPVENDDEAQDVDRHVIDVLSIQKANSLEAGLEYASRESVIVESPQSPVIKVKTEPSQETHIVTTSSESEQLIYEQTSESLMASVRFGITTTTSEISYIYSCQWENCVQQFISQDDLVSHVNECHIQTEKNLEYSCKWLECPRNGKGFNARYKMLIHMRTHTGERPHKCPQASCGKSFSRLENLKIHCRSHTGDKPYACPYDGCDKRYSNSSDRYKHTRTHVEKKPYHCKVKGCSKQYTDPSSLRKHIKSHQRVERVILMVDDDQDHDQEEILLPKGDEIEDKNESPDLLVSLSD